jgi:hypothetical protein
MAARLTPSLFLAALLAACSGGAGGEESTDETAAAGPPFMRTLEMARELVRSADPSAFHQLEPRGRGERSMFDRRVSAFVTVEAYLFHASFDDGQSFEIQVNPEFGSAERARAEATFFATEIGRLPTALRMGVLQVWIHDGEGRFAGDDNSLLIHLAEAAKFVEEGTLEEHLMHEAVHASIDPNYATSVSWQRAVAADGRFISQFAERFPEREDLAESYLAWMVLRQRPQRTSPAVRQSIERTIPARIAFFDQLEMPMHPFE